MEALKASVSMRMEIHNQIVEEAEKSGVLAKPVQANNLLQFK